MVLKSKKTQPSQSLSSSDEYQSPWYERLAVISLPKATSNKPGGLVAFVFVTDSVLNEEIADFFTTTEVYTQRALQGREFIYTTSFPATWTTHRVCLYLDALSDFIRSKGFTVSKRINFPNIKPTRSPWFSRGIYEQVESFSAWAMLGQAIYREEEDIELVYLVDEDDNDEDSLRGI